MEARETTVDILESISGALKKTNVKNPSDLKAIIDNTAGTAVTLLNSLKEILYNNDPDDIPISDKINAEYMPYDTDIPEDDADIPDDPEDAFKQNALKLTRIHSIEQVKKIASIVDDVGLSLVSKLIPGESLKSSLSTGFQMIISKFDASNLIGEDTDGDGIPDMKLRFEFDNNPSVVQFPLGFCPNTNIPGMISYECTGVYSIVTKCWDTITMIYPISAQRLHPGTKQIDVKVYDGYDHEVIIDNLSRDIEFLIHKDISGDLSEDFVHVDVSSKLESYDNKPPIMYHQFNISHPYSTLNLEIKAGNINDNSSIIILFGYNFLPTVKKCDFLKSMRDVRRNENGTKTLFINDELIKNQTGTWYLGVSTISNTIILKEGKTCSDFTLANSQLDSDFKSMNYSLRVYSGGCYYFNKVTEIWEGLGLKNLNLSRKESGCLSSHLSSFASGSFYLMNNIDFHLIFPLSSFSDNLTFFTFLALTFIAYLLALIYSIIMDRIDIKKMNVQFMADNHQNDTYMYEIVVETGPFLSSQVKCNIQFILFGENDITEIRKLNDETRDLFRSGSFDSFLLSTNRPLGPLLRLLIWTDSMGFGDAGSWYLMSLTVLDIQNGVKTKFIGNTWLALDRGDFEETAVLYPQSYEEPEDYKYLIRTSLLRLIKNHHLWLSIFIKPFKSRFTRVQRSTVCLTYYSLSMILNAFYYSLTPGHLIDSLFAIEFIGFDYRDILTGFVSSIIVTIPTILPVVMFTKSRNRKMRESRLNEGINIAINKKTLDIKVEGHQRKKNAIEKRRNRSYHYIFGIISWIFCFMIICTSITATIGIVVHFTNVVIYQFIVAMLVNWFTSFFIVQPIIITFLIFYHGFYKQSTNHFEDDHTEEDEEPPKIYFDINDNESIDRRPRNETPNRIHLDMDFKQRLKELRSSEFEMRQVIKELLTYFCYLSIVLIICFGPRDPNAHWEKKNIVVNVIHGGAMCEIYPNDDSRYRPCIETRASTDFQKIRDINDWWKWVETTLIPNTRVQPWYNDRPPYGFRGYLNDRVNRLIGYAIVRQIRQKIGVCRTHPFVREHIKDCLGEGSISSEDTTSWCENWKAKFLEPNCTEAPEYQYLSATELESLTVSGKINTYSGGGYVLRLQGYIGDLQKRIKKLQQDNWTDNRTRGLLAEFSVYNAQINMFATVTCIGEFVGGGIQPYHRVEVFKLFPDNSFFSEIISISEVLFVLATLYYTISTLTTLKKEGLGKFIKNFWNLTNFATILFSYTAIALFIVRLIIVRETTKRISMTRGNEYIRLTIPALINTYYEYSISFIAFTTSLKLCKLLGFQKTFRQIGLTIKLCFVGLSTFFIEFCILFGAFCSFFYFVLRNDLEKFRDFLRSFENTLAMSIGKFNFSELRDANLLAAWIFFAFSIAINMVLINMVMSIINLAFEEVKESKSISKNKFHLLQYAKNMTAQMIGIQNPKLIEPVYDIQESNKVIRENHLSKKASILMDYLETEYSSINIEERKFLQKFKEKAKDGNEKRIGFDTFFNPDNSLN
ncbi:location of vulva defective 1 [Lepeophtheirus salmonis]|uniref:location of vulva defective 1 n=1 Tax=Lepeophtheirus salmonis TaxID=72036 RepID=UPI003AF3F788